MWYIVAKKLGKNDAHDKKRKQGRKYAPEHTEVGTLILLFEITLYKLGKKEAMLLDLVNEAVFIVLFGHKDSCFQLLKYSISHSREKVNIWAVKLTLGFIFAKTALIIKSGNKVE